jgi:hypothetical protein
MRNAAEDRVLEFYSKGGWEEENGITEDARQFEDLRDCARDYVSRCRLRVMRHIPATGDKILDMASGPIPVSGVLRILQGLCEAVLCRSLVSSTGKR